MNKPSGHPSAVLFVRAVGWPLRRPVAALCWIQLVTAGSPTDTDSTAEATSQTVKTFKKVKMFCRYLGKKSEKQSVL